MNFEDISSFEMQRRRLCLSDSKQRFMVLQASYIRMKDLFTYFQSSILIRIPQTGATKVSSRDRSYVLSLVIKS